VPSDKLVRCVEQIERTWKYRILPTLYTSPAIAAMIGNCAAVHCAVRRCALTEHGGKQSDLFQRSNPATWCLSYACGNARMPTSQTPTRHDRGGL